MGYEKETSEFLLPSLFCNISKNTCSDATKLLFSLRKTIETQEFQSLQPLISDFVWCNPPITVSLYFIFNNQAMYINK